MPVDPQDVAQVFLGWVKQAVSIAAGQMVSMDGKALASTVEDGDGQQQDFVSVISAWVQQWEGVIGQLSFQTGQTSEIVGVRQLLEQLNRKGVGVTHSPYWVSAAH